MPKDALKAYPFLPSRTPYSVAAYGEDKYCSNPGSNELFVNQNVCGRYLSEGVFIERTDTFDTIAWLLKKIKGNNDKAGMIDAHPD